MPEEALRAACDETRSRGSGPGGQHRNKVETMVILRHRASGIEAFAGERRSQSENRSVALRRLRLALAVGLRGTAAPPSPLWRSRIRSQRIQCSPAHADYPALLAEALDALAAAGWEPRPAAEALGCTPTQLVRFVGDHPRARVLLDAERRARGLRTLR